ncbi:MAG: phenylalanine--tRNA ligase subunit beta, partial [Coriobacteriales bacterium]|nr:phenylalanine--tRNA ligase subunit beta [Coriobacteriales bacterium]
MKVSLKWLKTMVDVPVDLAEFTEQMQLTGTEVDAVDVVGARLDGVVVGQIIDKQPLPESDHLWVTTVDVGSFNLDASDSPSPLQIVCGAQNFNNGDKVAVALVGTTLPNGAQIKKTKLRGVESSGMNCSALELGLGEDHEGIMILPESAPVGTSLAEYLDLSDVVLDLDITPNRADCMSMLGVAREVAAVYGLDYQLPAVETLIESLPASSGSVSKLVSAQINDPIRCPRYTARLIRGVKVGSSPDWLVERVTAAGTRSVNNVVDITNYIMFELGQPLHVFDYDSLAQDASGQVKIVVRAAHDGEKFTTLDGVERLLEPDITCIVDANAAAGAGATIALAGVMGGLTSEVSDATVNVLLESAAFSANHTSRTSRRLQLVSESSMRYERGVDDRSSADYSLRAAILIAAVAGGVIEEGVVDCYPLPRELPELEFRIERFARFVGASIPVEDIEAILTRLGCTVTAIERVVPGSEQPPSGLQSSLRAIPPSYRPDLLREIDLYEEVLRVWGMNRVQPTLPGGRERTGQLSETQAKERQLGRLLRSMGLNETMTYAFVPPTDATDVPMGYGDSEQLVELINP